MFTREYLKKTNSKKIMQLPVFYLKEVHYVLYSIRLRIQLEAEFMSV
jgi:hypothetical protein